MPSVDDELRATPDYQRGRDGAGAHIDGALLYTTSSDSEWLDSHKNRVLRFLDQAF